MDTSLIDLLEKTLAQRLERLSSGDQFAALRLFNGFSEGAPGLAIDLYADTLLIHDLNKPAGEWDSLIPQMMDLYQDRIPWLKAIVLKTRYASSRSERSGRLLFGDHPTDRIMEHGTWYALDLLMQQDAGFYLDTANLRKWIIDHLPGKTVLNTFAYTGSLGIAALAGGAAKVTQLDRNIEFLDISKLSSELNGISPEQSEYLVGDFFTHVAKLKRQGRSFDCVILDPPFFSSGNRSRLDHAQEPARLINKLRPLVENGGWLISVNNALFLSGKDYMKSLEVLCEDGYLQIAEIIPVPETFCGWTDSPLADMYPANPSPFNHPTKIVILKVRRKE
jgi:23S rRNA (cytosine1962-C5)-methyltransferase